jgi:hypothetical protein
MQSSHAGNRERKWRSVICNNCFSFSICRMLTLRFTDLLSLPKYFWNETLVMKNIALCKLDAKLKYWGSSCKIHRTGHLENSMNGISRGLLGRDAMQCCGRIPTFPSSMLPPSSGWSMGENGIDISTSPWRWRQHGPLKRFYPTTTLHGITSQ